MQAATWQRLQQDLVQAQKSRNTELVAVLRLLQSALKNAEIEKMAQLEEVDVLAVLRKEVKRRQDAAAQYAAAGRPELAAKENAEITLIQPYLPAQMDDVLLEQLLREAVASLPEAQRRDFGAVMRAAKQKVGDRADGKRIADGLKKLLQAA